MPFFEGTSGRDTIEGTVGADFIDGFSGNDSLDGLEGKNTIFGGEGNDTIAAGLGRDIIDGGTGDDLIEIKGNELGTIFRGGFGQDIVSLDRADSGTWLVMDYGSTGNGAGGFIEELFVRIRSNAVSIEKTDDNDDETTDNIDAFSNLGEDGTLYLFGTPFDDLIEVDRSGPGPKIIFTAEGDDTFEGGSDSYEAMAMGQSSRAEGKGYNEITVTSSSSGQMSGRVVTTEGNGASTDSFTTRFSDIDLIIGSDYDDVMTGSSGDDHFRPGYGNDGFDGGGGKDTVYYDAPGILSSRVDLDAGFGAAIFTNDGFFDDFQGLYDGDRFVFEDQEQIDGLRNVENAVGSDKGSDVLLGSKGKNVLDGGGGDDRLNGRNGSDTLIGGDGDDKLRGSGGRDKFYFDGADGVDRIFGFDNGKDKIGLTDGVTFDDVSIVEQGRHTIVTFEQTTVRLLNIDVDTINVNDFVEV